LKPLKRKIVNDPVWGFIEWDSPLLLDLISHPYVQRLRRIKQLGLSSLVYPGANHTRFEHVIGATHLVRSALDVLKTKGHQITDEETTGVLAAILLHDVGHGPFSHALEESMVKGISHEVISKLFMHQLNREFDGRLDLAIQIFAGEYHKKFLHQLVSSQLDMDRLDYLKRDSFYSGVSEGIVSSDRIIKMLNIRNDELVVESKGIYSIEKFLIARRLMYWQVYMHKTVLSAEHMMISLLRRAHELASGGDTVFAPPALGVFLRGDVSRYQFESGDPQTVKSALQLFAELDDTDILSSIKEWTRHPDVILSTLSRDIINRNLFKIKLSSHPVTEKKKEELRSQVMETFSVTASEADYFVISGMAANNAYKPSVEQINVLFKNGKIKDIKDASDINLSGLSATVRKYFVCYPREIISK